MSGDKGMYYGEEDWLPLFDTPRNETHRLVDPQRVKEFVLAGNCKITLQSVKTTRHYTYKIKRGDGELWFVSRLSDEGYIYLGTIRADKSFSFTRNTPHLEIGGTYLKVFNWFWYRLQSRGSLHPKLAIFHEGRCGACGKELTDPVSIKEGYGPDCRRKKFSRPVMVP